MSTKSQSSDEGRPGEDYRGSLRSVLDQVQAGWRATSADVARDFVSKWSHQLHSETEIIEIGDSYIRFTSDLGGIRLLGMHEVVCLMTADAEAGASGIINTFWRGVNSPGKAVFVIALSAGAYRAAHAALPPGRYLLLGRTQVEKVLLSTAPLDELKLELRRQVSLSRLVPFDTGHAAEGNMFLGRSKLLRRLHEEESISFGIAGPSRIGKTSVLRRYRRLLQKTRDPALGSTFYVDLYKCSDKSNDGIARYIALQIEATKKTSTLTHDRLETFFRFWRDHFNRPVTLLLDEVDEVFWTKAFQYLGNAVRNGFCRLLLGGRGELLHGLLRNANPLQCRIDLLRLEPLQPQEAEQLLLDPLSDLGFQITDKELVLRELLRLTGAMPHALQFYGNRMARRLIDKDDATVSLDQAHHIRSTHEAASFFLNPLFEIKNAKSRKVAAAMMAQGTRPFSLPQMIRACDNYNIGLTLDEAWDAANELVIQNVLVWQEEKFRIANESLLHYSDTQDLVRSVIGETNATPNQRTVSR